MASWRHGKNQLWPNFLGILVQLVGLVEAVSPTPYLRPTQEKAHIQKRKSEQGRCPAAIELNGDMVWHGGGVNLNKKTPPLCNTRPND